MRSVLRIEMTKVMEPCDEKGMGYCDDRHHGVL